jgi:H+/Cl- antiporter ClcA
LNNRPASLRKTITREAGLLLGLLLVGLVVLPFAVYFVGQAIFGDYGGGSYGHFYSELSGRIRAADPAAWFLVLSPYLGWQTLRLIALGWRVAGRRPEHGTR